MKAGIRVVPLVVVTTLALAPLGVATAAPPPAPASTPSASASAAGGAAGPSAGTAASATGKRPASASAAASPGVSPSTLEKLKSNDPAQVKGALDDVRVVGKPAATAAAPLVAQLLDRGPSPELAKAAIETAADLESPVTTPSVVPYAQHRDVAVRRAAVKALARTKGPAAAKALAHALGDPDGMVRGVAAAGLGALKAREAVPSLLSALDHQIPEAAAAVGQLCAPAECEKLVARLGREPFDVVSSGFEQILFRPVAEIDDDTKVRIIEKVRELRTKEANRFLSDVYGRWPATASARVKQALDQAVKATAGSSS